MRISSNETYNLRYGHAMPDRTYSAKASFLTLQVVNLFVHRASYSSARKHQIEGSFEMTKDLEVNTTHIYYGMPFFCMSFLYEQYHTYYWYIIL